MASLIESPVNPDLATKVAPAEMIAAQTQLETAVEETDIAAPIDHGAIEQEDRINSTQAPTTTTQDVKQDGTQSEEEEEDPLFENDPELKFVRERLDTIAKEERSGADPEKIALEELGKSTKALIISRRTLKTRESELTSLDISDSRFQDVQLEIVRLTKETKGIEHQWSATKEVYYREFGPITDNAEPVTEVKAKAEHDIKMLQDQIANLQKQLDAVSLRRKQMAADAEEHHRKLAEHGEIDEDI
ncbi:hypothetical protein CPC16_001155 [Podila verticillata]|nr:hypothetical protein BGZ52_006449 [Haplosporangium bisporale]KAF9213496.1 hypothetical protein BGZ59_005283 [Podila verticillata]KAF9374617.1 hypothetical protein CPC16_001155 [Podila verticillata]